MPLRYEIRDRAIWAIAEGQVEYEQELATLTEALAAAQQEDAEQLWHIVFDVRASTKVRTPEELRNIAALVAEHRKELSGCCAILTADPLHYGMARMFEAFSEPHDMWVDVVRDLDGGDWPQAR